MKMNLPSQNNSGYTPQERNLNIANLAFSIVSSLLILVVCYYEIKNNRLEIEEKNERKAERESKNKET